MTATPAWTTVRQIIGRLEPELSSAKSLQNAPTVRVNGIDVPVLRLQWRNVGPFFEQLFDYSNRQHFRGHLPPCKLSWNKRFRRVGGRIDCRARLVELSAAHYESCGCAALGVVLLHEQVHLSLYEEGLAYGHTAEFKRRSLNLGLPDIHHEMPLPDRLRKPRCVHLYQCVCGTVVQSRIKFRKPRACATCCDRYSGGRYDRRFQLRYIGIKRKD
jgi:predicted SprT family Zn-dependent metalloprotease